MTSRQLNLVWLFCKWCFAAALVSTVYHLAYHRGELSGEQGVGYWQGWQDAMTATDYGKRPYNSEESLLR